MAACKAVEPGATPGHASNARVVYQLGSPAFIRRERGQHPPRVPSFIFGLQAGGRLSLRRVESHLTGVGRHHEPDLAGWDAPCHAPTCSDQAGSWRPAWRSKIPARAKSRAAALSRRRKWVRVPSLGPFQDRPTGRTPRSERGDSRFEPSSWNHLTTNGSVGYRLARTVPKTVTPAILGMRVQLTPLPPTENHGGVA